MQLWPYFWNFLPIITKSLYSGVFGAQKIKKKNIFWFFHFSGSLIGDFTISIAFKIGHRVKLCKTLRTHILELECWNFQVFRTSIIKLNGKNFIKIWRGHNEGFGSVDMEWPKYIWIVLQVYLNHSLNK